VGVQYHHIQPFYRPPFEKLVDYWQAGSKPLNFCLARKNNVFVVSQSFAFLIGSLVVRTQKGSKRAPPPTL
jgi:hypothetical protein